DALNAAFHMAEGAFSMFALHAGTAHQRACGAAQVVHDPGRQPNGGAETCHLTRMQPAENMGVVGKSWLFVEDIQRQLRQLERTGIALLSRRARDMPDAIRVDLIPCQRFELGAPLTCQQRELEKGTVGAVLICQFPEGADFVVAKNAVTPRWL